MRISDWSSDVCSSDLRPQGRKLREPGVVSAEEQREIVALQAAVFQSSGSSTSRKRRNSGTTACRRRGPISSQGRRPSLAAGKALPGSRVCRFSLPAFEQRSLLLYTVGQEVHERADAGGATKILVGQ